MTSFKIRPHEFPGRYSSYRSVYRERAIEHLEELKILSARIVELWPNSDGDNIRDQSAHPDLWHLCDRRDLTSDIVRISAAMAVEGFLNFYGVHRLGQSVFDEYYERLGLVPKLRGLLLICDETNIPKSHVLVRHLERLAKSRNALVHPETTELMSEGATPAALGVPGEASEAVGAMNGFFDEFVKLVPRSSGLM